MTLAQFARMCETIEFLTPTGKVNTITRSLSAFKDPMLVMKILSMDYPINKIGQVRAIKWIAQALEVFEDEINDTMYVWGEIGDAIFDMDEGNEEDSNITLSQFYHLLCLDCSRINSDSNTTFTEFLQMMSAREKKWFIRYWLRKPRNGVNNKLPLKIISLYFTKPLQEVVKYSQYNSTAQIFVDLQRGVEPECILSHGQFVSPMLAKPRKGKEHPNNYIIDAKYDGNRYQIHYKRDSVIIFNRKGKVVSEQFPDIIEMIFAENVLCNWGIFDAEIYPVKEDGSPAEHKLMAKRVHMLDKAKAVELCPVRLACFDILSCEGLSKLEEPLSARLKLLDEIVEPEYVAIQYDGSIEGAYNQAISAGFEGIMIKDASMAYQAGKRSKGWLKYKPPRVNLDVVILTGKYGDGKRSNVFGTFGIGVKDGADYYSVGQVGTGFSDDDFTRLTNELKQHVERFEGDTFHFLPRVVIEVTCDLISQDSDGNYGLRFPRCLGIRDDKYPADIDTLQRVKEMA
tara:strand:+ start:4286 stop:5824 length:1539 start_codon:yes stop_codon:yes gene_type:complete